MNKDYYRRGTNYVTYVIRGYDFLQHFDKCYFTKLCFSPEGLCRAL